MQKKEMFTFFIILNILSIVMIFAHSMPSDDSVFHFLHSDNRDQSQLPKEPNEQLPRYKSVCCMAYTIETACKRCPFKQIEDPEQYQQALKECRERRRGTYHHEDLTIEYIQSIGNPRNKEMKK